MLVVAQRNPHVGLFASIQIDRYSGLQRDVGKVAVAIIAVEIVRLAVVGYKQIQMSVVIEVAPHCCQPE